MKRIIRWFLFLPDEELTRLKLQVEALDKALKDFKTNAPQDKRY